MVAYSLPLSLNDKRRRWEAELAFAPPVPRRGGCRFPRERVWGWVEVEWLRSVGQGRNELWMGCFTAPFGFCVLGMGQN